jgi:hypothetical protein
MSKSTVMIFALIILAFSTFNSAYAYTKDDVGKSCKSRTGHPGVVRGGKLNGEQVYYCQTQGVKKSGGSS